MKLKPSLFLIAFLALLLLALALVAYGGSRDGYYLPERLARVWAPLPSECPPNYLRIDDYYCWDVFRPTAAPQPTPTGTLFYLPTLTPTAEAATP